MKYLEYALVFGVVLVMAFAFFVYRPAGAQAGPAGGLVPSGQNFQYYQQKAADLGNECGDLKDEGNVQHLGHHPDRYASCLKQVEPAFLEKATGKTLQQLVG